MCSQVIQFANDFFLYPAFYIFNTHSPLHHKNYKVIQILCTSQKLVYFAQPVFIEMLKLMLGYPGVRCVYTDLIIIYEFMQIYCIIFISYTFMYAFIGPMNISTPPHLD